MKLLTKQNTKKILFVLLFLLPAILIFLVIYAYPLITIFYTSFTEWNVDNLTKPVLLPFNRLFSNYVELFKEDNTFKIALLNSLKWAVLTALIQVPLAVIAAITLSKKPIGWKFTRNMFLIPNIISSAAIGLIFRNLYDPKRGLVTIILEKIFPNAPANLLINETAAFWCVTFAFILFSGTIMLLIMSQIASIPKEIYEAAEIDGANGFRINFQITLPLIKNSIGTALILACNYGLLLFSEIEMITSGGPDSSTFSLSYYIYHTSVKSSELNFAKANTAGVILFIIGLTMVMLINHFFNKEKDPL